MAPVLASCAAIARTAAVLGATGAVGTELVNTLVDQGWNVVLLNRRSVDKFTNKPNITQHIVPMDDESALESACAGVIREASASSLFISMGVGAPSKTPGQEGADILKRVDVALPSACARGAKAAGCVQHVSILTAVGADADAKPNLDDGFLKLLPMARASGPLYNQQKGIIEQNIKEMAFPTFSTFRPATLLGTPNTPPTLAAIAPKLDWLLPVKWKSSQIKTLAKAMVFDCETKLMGGDNGNVDGTTSSDAQFDVFEGQPLHDLYARTEQGR